MVKKAILYIIILMCTMVSLVNADLGTYQQNICVVLKAEVNSTGSNITIYYPNSTIAVDNQAMTKLKGMIFNYSFCDTNELGKYIYDYCDQNGDNCKQNTFSISPTGDELNIGQGIMYMFMLLAMVCFFLLFLFGAIKLPFRNERGGEGDVVKIQWKKYLKLFCIGMCYVTFVWIVFISWNLSWGYLQMRGLSVFFKYLFYLVFSLSLPAFVGFIILFTVSYINDKKIQRFQRQFEEIY